MIVVTTNEVEGRRVVKVLGTVEGSIVRARHMGSDLMAGLRNIVGGEVHGYSRLMTEARAHGWRSGDTGLRDRRCDRGVGG